MILEGLSTQIRMNQVNFYQKEVVKSITRAASNGNNQVSVSKKGFTPDFVDELADEGVETEEHSDKFLLRWDGLGEI